MYTVDDPKKRTVGFSRKSLLLWRTLRAAARLLVAIATWWKRILVRLLARRTSARYQADLHRPAYSSAARVVREIYRDR
jgi:hypothetical protein